MNTRIDLADKIRAEVPATWTVIPYGVELENPLMPHVVVRQVSVARNAGAPRLYRDTGFTVALVEPGLAPDKVETALDDDVEILLDVLERIDIPGLIWTGADRVTFEGRFHGYEIHALITDERVGQ